SWHQYMRQVGSTGARHDRMAISKEDFIAMPLPVLSPEEKQKIADCLSSLDALIAAQADKIDALKAHKKGVMQQLFPSPEAVRARDTQRQALPLWTIWPHTCAKDWSKRSISCSLPSTALARRACPWLSRTWASKAMMRKKPAILFTSTPLPKICFIGTTIWNMTPSECYV